MMIPSVPLFTIVQFGTAPLVTVLSLISWNMLFLSTGTKPADSSQHQLSDSFILFELRVVLCHSDYLIEVQVLCRSAKYCFGLTCALFSVSSGSIGTETIQLCGWFMVSRSHHVHPVSSKAFYVKLYNQFLLLCFTTTYCLLLITQQLQWSSELSIHLVVARTAKVNCGHVFSAHGMMFS